MHQVDDHRLVSLEVILPGLFASLKVIIAFAFQHRDQRFVLDSVQVLVKPIKKDVKKLL